MKNRARDRVFRQLYKKNDTFMNAGAHAEARAIAVCVKGLKLIHIKSPDTNDDSHFSLSPAMISSSSSILSSSFATDVPNFNNF